MDSLCFEIRESTKISGLARCELANQVPQGEKDGHARD